MSLFYLAAFFTGIAALALALWPMVRQGYTRASLIVGFLALGVGLGVYTLASNFNPALPTSAKAVQRGAADMTAALGELQDLEARLLQEPNDAQGWALLARSYMSVEQIPKAVAAYKRAYDLVGDKDPMLMIDYAEALAAQDPNRLSDEAGQMIERALVLAPTNLRALWYGASVAATRGDRELAATRFESMLRPDTPENVRAVLLANIQALRADASVPSLASSKDNEGATTLTVRVDLAEQLAQSFPPTAVFYLIATTSAGGPPLAVVKLPVAAIPGSIDIGDADAMLPGRTIGTQSEIKLTARISMAGQPIAKAGDLYAERMVSVPNAETLELVIADIVP